MTEETIRFGDFVRDSGSDRSEISYNALAPKIERDSEGNLIPYKAPKAKLRGVDIYRLIAPYVSVRFKDQLQAVVPLAVYLAIFQLFILNQVVQDSWMITGGLFAVIFGLMLFMEGLEMGLIPFGTAIGDALPKKAGMPVVLTVAFLLGVGVTFAEPAIGALKEAGKIVSVEKAPYLYALLNDWSGVLVMVVGMGVGLAAILGTLRFLYDWSLKPMIYGALTPAVLLSLYAWTNPALETMLGLAWDCGAVTTGPVTVPLVLSLGIGIASAGGSGESKMSGFGIVTLASVFPIIGVLGLAIFLSFMMTPEEIIAGATAAVPAAGSELLPATTAWYESSPGAEFKGGVQAILPLVIFLFIVMYGILKEKVKDLGFIIYGIFLAIAGMVIFNVGLTYGLSALGAQTGGLVPASFMKLEIVTDSPLYVYGAGLGLSIAFAWILGFGATLAEPALNALGATVETLTQGVFKKSTLMYAVSLGVAFGLAIGISKIIFNIPIMSLILPFYALGVVLTYFSSEEFVNIAWDSAGVTTGPITVPLVLAMGLGFGEALGALEGFGILSMASICPILSVLITGLWVQYKEKQAAMSEENNPAEVTVV